MNKEIESLSPLEHVRLRSDVYTGDCSDATQLIIEILGNAIDEYNIGYGKEIIVKTDNKKHIYSVEDYGRGFPINELRDDGETTLQASFDVLNTSGKFRNDGTYSGVSLGKNGQGSKLTNFLSHFLKVYTCRNYEYEFVQFKEGVFQKRELGTSNKEHGTKVEFNPSEEFFDSPTINEIKVKQFCNEITCLCPGLIIDYNGEKIFHENGIVDLLNSQVKNNIETISNHFIEEFNYGKQGMSVGLTYTSSSSSNIISYVNCGLTNAGPHIASMKSTITRVLNKWAKENHLLNEKDKNLDGSSLQEGLILVSNITAENVKYEAQVKSTVTKIDTSFSSILGQKLELWLDNNPEDGKAIIEKALIARKAYEAAKKAREAVKAKAEKKTKLKIASMPSKLADCHSKDRSRCELYLTEGDSASGGCKIIRDASFQAILGLRGKVLNCLTADMKRIQKNAEIIDIIKALGLQWAADGQSVIYDEKKLRYDKLIIAADKDPDGSHIQSLICTMLWALVPDLILDGHVYVALPPLYKAEWGKQYEYLDDKKALEEFKKKHKDFTLTYFKGLGEASPQELGMMIMDPKTRNVQQISVEDMGFASKTISDLMGNDTQAKKEFVFGHEIKEIV